jgi:hypothetical protein
MRDQFDKLVLQPLLSINPSDIPIDTLVIVIDALDECEGDNDVRLILQLLPQLYSSQIAIRLSVLGTSPNAMHGFGFEESHAKNFSISSTVFPALAGGNEPFRVGLGGSGYA